MVLWVGGDQLGGSCLRSYRIGTGVVGRLNSKMSSLLTCLVLRLAGQEYGSWPGISPLSTWPCPGLAWLLFVWWAQSGGTSYRSIHSKRSRQSCKASFDLVSEDMQRPLLHSVDLVTSLTSHKF